MPAETGSRHLKGISPVQPPEDSYEEIVDAPALEQEQEQEKQEEEQEKQGDDYLDEVFN